MKLPCANCKAIQSFSGDPPKCDVCDWVSTEESQRHGLAKGLWNLVKALFFWGVAFVFGFGLLLYWFTPEKEKLADQYHVSQENVFVTAKPHGCDFNDAPLGNKHCHYEKYVDVERACPEVSCQVTVVHVRWQKTHQPNVIVNFFDADSLSGKDLTEIDFSLTQTDAAAARDHDALVVERAIDVLQAASHSSPNTPSTASTCSLKKGKSVTYVSDTVGYLCVGSFKVASGAGRINQTLGQQD